MKSNSKSESKPVVKENKKAIGTAAHAVEGPKTIPGPKTATTDPTKPPALDPNEKQKG